MFAECMYHFAIDSEMLSADAPFVSFNCADYAQNPQLLFGHIFGIKKGAYTGAAQDSPGLIAKADGGILFLDEIHRLPPEGQEMLFTFMDKGVYRFRSLGRRLNLQKVSYLRSIDGFLWQSPCRILLHVHWMSVMKSSLFLSNKKRIV